MDTSVACKKNELYSDSIYLTHPPFDPYFFLDFTSASIIAEATGGHPFTHTPLPLWTAVQFPTKQFVTVEVPGETGYPTR